MSSPSRPAAATSSRIVPTLVRALGTDQARLQCGFCTPGMVLAATGLLLDDPDEHAIREGIEGNLCRCTGDAMIVGSVRRAAQHGDAGPSRTGRRTTARTPAARSRSRADRA